MFFILCYFLPFYPSNNPKNQNFKKWRKPLKISSSYTSVPKIMIICYTVPEIWCVTDIIIFHFGLFLPFYPLTAQKIKISKNKKNPWRYHHFTQVYQKSWSYAILFLRHGMWWMQLLFSILGYFLPFYPCNLLKKWKFQKNEKDNWKYHHFTQVCQKSCHMLCCSWDMVHDRCNRYS